ncbi:hypothetical protein DERF_006576 [Dermatophagoides farinae]|uniref:Secreted protein n=1 Tax=Dermatophagoides farinae TaxID=6954 RepID=A0A922L740_DERFA|nr:hypothetical protein DERF_006576 [Dermatophagoides farinae]
MVFGTFFFLSSLLISIDDDDENGTIGIFFMRSTFFPPISRFSKLSTQYFSHKIYIQCRIYCRMVKRISLEFIITNFISYHGSFHSNMSVKLSLSPQFGSTRKEKKTTRREMKLFELNFIRNYARNTYEIQEKKSEHDNKNEKGT